MKYIRLSRHRMILFDEMLNHVDMVRGGAIKHQDEVISAGFFYVQDGRVSISERESTTLQVGPILPDDRVLVQASLGGFGSLELMNLEAVVELGRWDLVETTLGRMG